MQGPMMVVIAVPSLMFVQTGVRASSGSGLRPRLLGSLVCRERGMLHEVLAGSRSTGRESESGIAWFEHRGDVV